MHSLLDLKLAETFHHDRSAVVLAHGQKSARAARTPRRDRHARRAERALARSLTRS